MPLNHNLVSLYNHFLWKTIEKILVVDKKVDPAANAFFSYISLKKKSELFSPHYRWDKYIRSTSDKEALSVEHQPKGLRLSNKLIHHMGVNIKKKN